MPYSEHFIIMTTNLTFTSFLSLNEYNTQIFISATMNYMNNKLSKDGWMVWV